MMAVENNYTILLVDDELEMCRSLSKILESEGYQVIYTTNPLVTIDLLEQKRVDLILMDVKMPQVEGVDLLKQVKLKDASLPVIMLTGYPSLKSAVQAMRYGAANFYTKPPKLPELLNEIKHLTSSRGTKKATKKSFKHEIVTQNKGMERILRDLEKAAPTNAAVLITGESGTGKELAARSIHYLSHRKDKPFVKVNCAALPDTLLESELFGHEKGAFTDAHQRREGRFEVANEGTIFLDEIGDMSLTTQAKILRVVQEQEFERLGKSDLIKTDIRIIAATNKNFKSLIEQGLFREDLYYRLSVISVHLPPLRERKEDIELLTSIFIQHFNKAYSKNIESVSGSVKELLTQHNWPGNVRELKNCVERAVIFCESLQIQPEDLPNQYTEVLGTHTAEEYEQSLDNLNREIIANALLQANGVKKEAAKVLNINRRTLYNKMKKLGME